MLPIKQYLAQKRIPDTRRGRFFLEALVVALCVCAALLILVIVFLRSHLAVFRQESDTKALPERVKMDGGASLVRISSPLPLPGRIAGVFPFLAQESSYGGLFSAYQKDFLVRIPADGWNLTRLEKELRAAFLRLSPAQKDIRLPDDTWMRAVDESKVPKTHYFGDFLTIGDKKSSILGGIFNGYAYFSNSPKLFFDIFAQLRQK